MSDTSKTPPEEPTKPAASDDDVVETMVDKMKPILSNLSFGSLMGYCSGVAMVKAGKSAAMLIGAAFIGLQGLASFGYISIDWNKIKVETMNQLDENKDGKVDVEDAKAYWRKIRTLLTNKIPAAGGFSLGFMYGVKHEW